MSETPRNAPTIQSVLDTLHAISDARFNVSMEFDAYRKQHPTGNLTAIHMPSWGQSVAAERGLHIMLMRLPRDAKDLAPADTSAVPALQRLPVADSARG